MMNLEHSIIHCDTASCGWRIQITQDIDEAEAAAVVRELGGSTTVGTERAYHHCKDHHPTRSKT